MLSLMLLLALGSGASAHAEPLPNAGRFNLHCSISIHTVSDPPLPSSITADYAVDLDKKSWCAVDRCSERYRLREVSGSFVEFVVKDEVADKERFLVNLETGKLAGSADAAPNGLINGFSTYLADGECAARPYSNGK